jgi:hypothetical protein
MRPRAVVEHRPADEHPSERVRLELERRDDAEIAASAAERPEELPLRVVARAQHLAVGCHDLGRHQAVDREPELAAEPAEPAAEREAGERRCATRGRPGRRVRAPGSRGRRCRAAHRRRRDWLDEVERALEG